MTTIPHFPFTREPFRAQMGLKPLDLRSWIEQDEQLLPQLRQKAEIFRRHKDITYAMLPGAQEACFELEEVLRDHLLRQFPERYSLNGNRLQLKGLGEFPVFPEEPLLQLAHYVQEDFNLMSPQSPVLLEAAAVGFLSRWRVSEKVGKDNRGIHEPVPHFEPVAQPSTQFLESIPVDRPMWRANWTMQDSSELFVPEVTPQRMHYTKENVLESCWLRIERQTLRRLPRTRYVVFTIRTSLHKMSSVVSDPQSKELAFLTFSTLPASLAVYKGTRFFWEELVAALRP